MEMAVSLVSTMATDFTPEEYRDDYSIALNTIIEAKLKGEKITIPEAPKVEITDLMAALKASLEAAQQKSVEKEQARAATGKS
jgi:DNA end-binding protein Ku